MTTKAFNICHPEVMIQYIKVSVAIYKGNECVFHLFELFFWDKSESITFLIACLWQQPVVLCINLCFLIFF